MYNLLGQGVPLVVALVALPLLIQGLGAERFGILALSWVVLGYFGLFDLGLGRVITKMVSEKLGSQEEELVPQVVWTGLFFMLMLGVALTLILYLLSPVLVTSVFNISEGLQSEAHLAMKILSFSLPFVILTVGLRAVLEAYQKFGWVNIIRTTNGALLYLTPLLVLPFTANVAIVILSLAIVRALVMIIYGVVSLAVIPDMRHLTLNRGLAAPMFRLGSWMSVSNVLGPIMVYFDRFLMGAWLSVTALTFYVTPYEVITKLLVVTSSFIRVLFPAFSASIETDRTHAATLYSRGVRVLLLGFFPITLLIVLLGPWGLSLWLGSEFAQKSAAVMQWLALGIFVNAPGQVAYAILQAAGRPDITAKIHIVETPFYILALFLFIQWFGIVGAAMAWTLRLIVESYVLFHFAENIIALPVEKRRESKLVLLISLIFFVVLMQMTITGPFLIVLSILMLIVLVPMLAFWLLTRFEKSMITRFLKRSGV